MSERAELARLRAICLALPGVEERLSHGTPAFFARNKQFVHYWDNHHEEALRVGGRERLLHADRRGAPDRQAAVLVPPYVGHRGWLGVNLDQEPDWKEVEHIVGYAHKTVSPARAGRGSSGARSRAR